MVGSIALMLLGAAASPTPCDALASVKLDKATITSSVLVPEGPRLHAVLAAGAPVAAAAATRRRDVGEVPRTQADVRPRLARVEVARRRRHGPSRSTAVSNSCSSHRLIP